MRDVQQRLTTAYVTDRDSVMAKARQVTHIVGAYMDQHSVFNGLPQVRVGSAGVTVQVVYYLPSHKTKASGVPALTGSSVQALASELSTVFGQSVTLVLVRLSQPYLDAHVLAAYLSKRLAGKDKFTRVMRRLFTTAMTAKKWANVEGLPWTLIGIKVELHGRLTSERSRPRTTVQTAEQGCLTNTAQASTQSSSYTDVNHKGSYTVKVWLCTRRTDVTH